MFYVKCNGMKIEYLFYVSHSVRWLSVILFTSHNNEILLEFYSNVVSILDIQCDIMCYSELEDKCHTITWFINFILSMLYEKIYGMKYNIF